MERIRLVADLVIRRALAFAGFAVLSLMAGLAFHPPVALRTAAVLTALITAVLGWKAWKAPQQPYRRTELWVMLDRRHGLPEQRAQQTIGQVLRSRYLWHAERAAVVSLGLWLAGMAATALLPGADTGA